MMALENYVVVINWTNVGVDVCSSKINCHFFVFDENMLATDEHSCGTKFIFLIIEMFASVAFVKSKEGWDTEAYLLFFPISQYEYWLFEDAKW